VIQNLTAAKSNFQSAEIFGGTFLSIRLKHVDA